MRSKVQNGCGISPLEEWLGNLRCEIAGRVADLPFAGGPNLLRTPG
jgi:hypothetical protein